MRSSLSPCPTGSASPASPNARRSNLDAMAARACSSLRFMRHFRKVSVCLISIIGQNVVYKLLIVKRCSCSSVRQLPKLNHTSSSASTNAASCRIRSFTVSMSSAWSSHASAISTRISSSSCSATHTLPPLYASARRPASRAPQKPAGLCYSSQSSSLSLIYESFRLS